MPDFHLVQIGPLSVCFPGLLFRCSPQFPAASLSVARGPCRQTTQGRRDQRQGAFLVPPPTPAFTTPQHTHYPATPHPPPNAEAPTTFSHWLLMFCKESPSTLAPSLQLSPWPRCPVPTLYPDVRRVVKGRKVRAPGSTPPPHHSLTPTSKHTIPVKHQP